MKNRNLQGYVELFAENVDRFFLLDSVSNKNVYDHMQWYWKSYPKLKTPMYNLHSMSIDKDLLGYIIFLPSQKDDSEIITEIRLNKDFKIYYIRDYHAYINKRK